MATKLYVGSLSYSTTDESLRNAFSQAGSVSSATVIIDKMTGKSRGFGFVEMSSDDEAQKAIEMLNGRDVDGRKVTVNEARPLRPAGEGGGRGGGFRPRGGFGGGGYGR